jgi:hypothetical protein
VLQGARERLGCEVKRELRVAGPASEKREHRTDMPAIEDAERLRLAGSAFEQLSIGSVLEILHGESNERRARL